MITGAPDVASLYETEQLSEELNRHEVAVKTPVVLLLLNETVSPCIEPKALDTVAVQIDDAPAATEAGLHTRVVVGR